VYVPVLFSFCMPLTLSLLQVVLKTVVVVKKVDAKEFSFAYYGFIATSFFIAGLVSFYRNKGSFSIHYWLIGLVGSFCQVFGVFFAISGVATGAPLGPQSAVINCQTIVVTFVYSLISFKLPTIVQLVGLLFGFVGALILVIPT
jgi:hypothetical protein